MHVAWRASRWPAGPALAAIAVVAAVVITIFVQRALFHDATAHPPSAGDTVRIAALRTDDGGVRVALQQRVDGGWGERQRPSAHLLPASAPANRWLVSSALTTSGRPIPPAPL